MNMMRCGRFMTDDEHMGKHGRKGGRHGMKMKHYRRHMEKDHCGSDTSDNETIVMPVEHHGQGLGFGLGRSFVRKNKMVVLVNVFGFAAGELSIKVENGMIAVSGKHAAEHADGSSMARQFEQTFKLPEQVELDSLKSKLVHRNRMLKITAKVKPAADADTGMAVPIEIVPSTDSMVV